MDGAIKSQPPGMPWVPVKLIPRAVAQGIVRLELVWVDVLEVIASYNNLLTVSGDVPAQPVTKGWRINANYRQITRSILWTNSPGIPQSGYDFAQRRTHHG